MLKRKVGTLKIPIWYVSAPFKRSRFEKQVKRESGSSRAIYWGFVQIFGQKQPQNYFRFVLKKEKYLTRRFWYWTRSYIGMYHTFQKGGR